MDDQFLEWARG